MIRVLVVDDSAFNRRTISRMLESDAEIEVMATANNGEEAMKLAMERRPDVITLDLEMPGMDGFTFLRLFYRRFFIPIIVVSSMAAEENVFKALELGALDFIAKPGRTNTHELNRIRDILLEKVHAVATVSAEQAARAQEARGILPPPVEEPPPPPLGKPATEPPTLDPGAAIEPTPEPVEGTAVVIGASTGGPAALQKVIAELPGDLPFPILVALHMPEGFTRSFAERLDQLSRLQVREASHGEPVRPGSVLIAPGGMNLTCRGYRGQAVCHVAPADYSERYSPSVNQLFTSAAKVFGPNLLGIVLTGMGDDGLGGARAIREEQGEIVAESEETAVIYGMPKQVVEAGLARRVLALPHIVSAIRHWRGADQS